MKPLLLAGAILAAAAASARADDCLRTPPGPSWRVVVAGEGTEHDPRVAAGIAAIGGNAMATLSPPDPVSAAVAQEAGLGYLPRIPTSDVLRLPQDGVALGRLRAIPGISGFHYLDFDVLEGYATPETQARAYGTLKTLFPAALVLTATRLDPVATDPTYLDTYFRPEYTDLVTLYFYPVGTTVLGTQEEDDPWPERLRALLLPVAERIPAGKGVLPVLQGFAQSGHPVGRAFTRRQLEVYRSIWPENRNVAAFWWGGGLDEPLIGFSEIPPLLRGIRQVFGSEPSHSSPCRAPARPPVESRP